MRSRRWRGVIVMPGVGSPRLVMPGLDTASRVTRLAALHMQKSGKPDFCGIHRKEALQFKRMDCRVEPGNDGGIVVARRARIKPPRAASPRLRGRPRRVATRRAPPW